MTESWFLIFLEKIKANNFQGRKLNGSKTEQAVTHCKYYRLFEAANQNVLNILH
jgi:hypothetical protein